MGLMSFLSSLVNGDEEEDETALPNRKWGYDQEGYLTPGIAGQENAGPPQSQGGMSMIDEWTPKKGTVLGALADAVSFYENGTTPFSAERDKMNMRNAMEGMAEDPMRAAARVAQVDPEIGMKLHGQAVDDKRQQHNLDRQNELLEFQKRKLVFDRVGNMMGVARSRYQTRGGDDGTWSQMRQQAINYAQQHGIDVTHIIPEQYDADAVETIALGEMPVTQQVKVAVDQDQHRETMGYRREVLDERREHHRGTREQGGARVVISEGNLDERRRNNRVNNNLDERQETRLEKKTPEGRQNFQTKWGIATTSKDRMTMRITPRKGVADDGDGYIYYVNTGTPEKPFWQRTRKAPKKKK